MKSGIEVPTDCVIRLALFESGLPYAVVCNADIKNTLSITIICNPDDKGFRNASIRVTYNGSESPDIIPSKVHAAAVRCFFGPF